MLGLDTEETTFEYFANERKNFLKDSSSVLVGSRYLIFLQDERNNKYYRILGTCTDYNLELISFSFETSLDRLEFKGSLPVSLYYRLWFVKSII